MPGCDAEFLEIDGRRAASRCATYSRGRKPGWGPAKELFWKWNRYIGRRIGRPQDLKAVAEGAGRTPGLDWGAPVFDPADPDSFDAFMPKHRDWIMRLFEQQFGKPVTLGR